MNEIITNVIIIGVIVIIITLPIIYIVKTKKQGQKCIGCPLSKTCQKNKCSCKETK